MKTWTDLVNDSPTPDVYFRPGYAVACCGDDATVLALVIKTSRRRFLVPLLLREIAALPLPYRVETYDSITPYGYGGVLPLDPGVITKNDAAELLEQIRQWCIKANVVTALLRLHPLLGQRQQFNAAAADCTGVNIRNGGPTAAIDLSAWDDPLCAPACMRKGRRSDLRHARKHLTLRLTSCDSPQATKMLQQFRSLYELTMSRLNATPFYFFSDEYYGALQRVLGSNMAVCVAYAHEEPVGAALFLADAQFGHYHLSGVTPEGKVHKAQTLVLVEGAQWMRRRGCRWLHLGGGRAPADSLFSFKHSFGAHTFEYSYLTIIADTARYDELVNLHCTDRCFSAGGNFFPAYRKPER